MAEKIKIVFEDALALPTISLAAPDGKRAFSLRGNRPPQPIEVGDFLRGPPGDVGTRALVSLTAGATVSGHRAIMFDATGNGIPADPTNPLYSFVGISISGANVGNQFEAQLAGLIEEPSWSFTPLLPIFAGANGTLTQARPWTGILHVIAVAQSPTSILISPQTPITLSSV
jgi:hypothetical protein